MQGQVHRLRGEQFSECGGRDRVELSHIVLPPEFDLKPPLYGCQFGAYRNTRRRGPIGENLTMSMSANPQTIRGACGHDCPDTCHWMVDVREGVAERLYGDPSHPFTRGTLCAKVNQYLERVYHPDRVLHPMKRVGAKGDARFVRVSWDEALTDIASRWLEIAEKWGAEAILPYSSAGVQGLIQQASV